MPPYGKSGHDLPYFKMSECFHPLSGHHHRPPDRHPQSDARHPGRGFPCVVHPLIAGIIIAVISNADYSADTHFSCPPS